MATSGTIYGPKVSSFNSKYPSNNNYLYIEWSESNVNTANNTSVVTATLKFYNTYGTYSDSGGEGWTITINGTKYSGTVSGRWSGSITVGTATSSAISHDSNGTKTITISATFDLSGTSSAGVYASGSATLTSIARGTTISHSLESATETTATISWTAGDTCDKVWYKLNNNAWENVSPSTAASSGTYTISGLSPNTSYTVITDVRRKVSGVETQSSSLSVSTYAYPYASSMPNFIIGNAVTIGLYNPLSRSVKIQMTDASGNAIGEEISTSGASVSGWNTSTITNALYNSIPKAKSGTYKISVNYSSASQTNTRTGGTYTVNESAAAPLITGGTYQDTNSTVTAITADNKKIIPNKSTLTFTGTGIGTNKGAESISSVILRINNVDTTMTYSKSNGTAIVTGINLNSVQQTASIIVTDSRGISTTKTIELDTVEYSTPKITATAVRQSGFYSNTNITPTATFTQVGNNTITISFSATASGTSTITDTLDNNISSTIELNNSKNWSLNFTATDSFGSVGTYTLQLGQGVPLVFFDTQNLSVGINKIPTDSLSLEIGGKGSQTDMTSTEINTFISELNRNFRGSVDWIVEQGTEGIWTYRKWDSGIAECWGTHTITGTWTAWGNLYELTGGEYRASYPTELFIERPICISSPKSSSVGVFLESYTPGTATSTEGVIPLRPTTTTVTTIYINFYAKGRWK